ncbi:MAG: homogentisate 1,2-dioxygenase [Myxococcales bacterium]|nr:homogentisate 1,2-dioxygenase [Myxococcales bacterium]
MLDRHAEGLLPAKHHIVMRKPDGGIYHEECVTRQGFDGPYVLIYHENEPHRHSAWRASAHGFTTAAEEGDETARVLRRRHFRTDTLAPAAAAPLNSRTPLMFNDDVVTGVLRPTESDPVYFANLDGDELIYIHEGRGTLRSILGDVEFGPKDYVFVPRGIKHRWIVDANTPQHWAYFECRHDFFLPKQWRTSTGQIRMDAPFCHRDFRRPVFNGPVDEGIRTFVVKRDDRFTEYEQPWSPLDCVGWDGSVYPYAFHILSFQPRAGLVHLPPDWHGNFAFPGGLICSFVPRVVDFHPEAIPCPYPHESVHCDEYLFYSEGNFVSRRGIERGSVSFHPRGILHGPHPGAYEGSIGHARTNELAVMMDTFKPLKIAASALPIEDDDYHASWRP